MTKRYRTLLYILIILPLLFLLLLIYIPGRKEKQLSAICRVTLQPYYVLPVTENDTVYISADVDSTETVAALTPETLGGKRIQSGVFVSREGHFFTTAPAPSFETERLAGDTLKGRIQQVRTILELQRQKISERLTALKRYARIHSTVDDGYNEVMGYYAEQERLCTSVRRTLSLLDSLKGGEAILQYAIQASVFGDSTTRSALIVGKDRELLLARLQDGRLPSGSTRMSVYRFGAHPWRSRLFAYNDIGKSLAPARPVRLEKADPRLSASEGGAFINRSGNLCGLLHDSRRISSIRLARLMNKVHPWPVWWYLNLKNLIGEDREKSETTIIPAANTSRQEQSGMIYEGEIDQKGKKHGYGILTLSNGTSYNGLWQGDTLTYGTRYDSTGIYVGHFSRALHPEGSGIYYSPKGERYSGEWKDGRRDGLGYAVAGDRLIRCGTWRENIFKGERMVYTADRVYGIDISRHQHEKGRKRFPLKWNDLRITSLGTARRVNGKVNYPVSFVYIKATEGRTVLNRYYLSDLREARRHGIAVGSYHFYSPTTSGEQQALWFLKKASIGTKDLPPVLDIEPTETQITRMGGEARLFTEVTAWLKTVTSRTGRKPILYVSQNFINNHLEKASPYIKGHEVWIARYSEFKPYVHLLHWQLTPHGRVNGITGEVDINVYNGTKEQFIEYLSRNGRQ